MTFLSKNDIIWQNLRDLEVFMDKQEQKYFKDTLDTLDKKIEKTKKIINRTEEELQLQKKSISEDFYEITKGQSQRNDSSADDLARFYSQLSQLEEISVDKRNELARLQSQRKSPYFSRIDFTASNSTETEKIYIGLATLSENGNMLVYDWRAPISSMYYDFGIGQASYKVGKNLYRGEINLKRQYKIENSEMLGYFDTTLAIEDDILRDVLSKNASPKMKQIVSSIQKEQNIIVRTEEFDNILVQGVAGSGKTSIALHRAAYLLYSHRNTIKSSDILIMSPNNIFSSYISNVLPELGEENLIETSYEQIAKVELRKPLESREDMLDRIATNPTQEELNEISYKSSFEYLGQLIQFLRGDFLRTFTPKKLSYVVGSKVNLQGEEETVTEEFPADMTSKLFFDNFKNMTIAERISKIAAQYARHFSDKRGYNKEQRKGLKQRFKNILYNFLPIKDIFKVFEIFLSRVDLKINKSDDVAYMDKGALLIIKNYIYGFSHEFDAKYLIIDEMQDFSPVDLFVFKKLWACPSIVLGDINQCIEKSLSPEYLKQVSEFLETELIELKKTYRSTREIAEFAHNMIGLKDVEYVNRSGQKPTLVQTNQTAEEISKIIANECQAFDHIAIICKCQKELQAIAKILKNKVDFKILEEAEDYNARIILTTCATAKGIEFDCVIIPNADQDNYYNSLDRNILYVSSTRALHKLFFLSYKTPTKFLKNI